jgi:glycine dehydrogenase subunit 2
MKEYNKLIFELSKPGRKAYSLPALDVEEKALNSLIIQIFQIRTMDWIKAFIR